jgi:hypothetical protein
LSFFEEGDEPSTATEAPIVRRPPSRPAGGRRAPLDDRTLRARRAGAIGTAIVVVVLAVLGIKLYLASAESQALKNYNAEVTTLVESEQTQVSQPLFTTMASAAGVTGSAEIALQTSLYEDAVTARQEEQQAAGWSVPSQMAGAQQDFLLVLQLRYEALNQIQADIDTALGSTGAQTALEEIAGAMQMLAASDVIYAVRVEPLIEEALENDSIQVASVGSGGVPVSGQDVVSSVFLPTQSWTLTSYVAGKILGSTPSNLGGAPLTGTIGDALVGVSVGSEQLSTPGINQVPFANNLVFNVDFDNASQNTAYDVTTKLTLSSASFSPIVTTHTERQTVPGQSYTESLVFAQAPPRGVVLKLKAEVEPVAGETDTANNSMTYFIEFS